MLIATNIAIAVDAAAPKAHQLTANYSFEQYLIDFPGKPYHLANDLAELSKRRAIFETELKEVLHHNSLGLSWTKGINAFSDLTEEEFLAQYTGDVLPKATLDELNQYTEEYQLNKLLGSDEPIVELDEELPEDVNWMGRGFMSKHARNQGNCGSCFAHAAVTTLEMYLHAKAGRQISLSTQQIVDCAHDTRQCGGQGGCKGSAAFFVLNDYARDGLTTEEEYPYFSGTTRDKGECQMGSTPNKKIVVKTGGASKVKSNSSGELQRALAHHGALAVSVDATGLKSYEGGIFTQCHRDNFSKEHNKYEVTTNHAVVLIGYTKAGDQNIWSVLNSWGSNWGVDGRFFIPRTAVGQPEDLYIDLSPSDGTRCEDEPDTPYVVAGCMGILSNAWYPNQVRYFP